MDNENNTFETENITNIMEIGDTGLTKDYVYKKLSKYGFEYSMYILYKDISSIEVAQKSYPIFILLAIIMIVLTIISKNYYYIIQDNFLWITSIVFLSIYFSSKKKFIIITSHGGTKIQQPIAWYQNKSDIEKLVEKIIEIKKQSA